LLDQVPHCYEHRRKGSNQEVASPLPSKPQDKGTIKVFEPATFSEVEGQKKGLKGVRNPALWRILRKRLAIIVSEGYDILGPLRTYELVWELGVPMWLEL